MRDTRIPAQRESWEERLVRHLTDVAELMVRSSDVDQVLTRLVHECTWLVPADGACLMLSEASQRLRTVAVTDTRLAPGAAVQSRGNRGPTVDAVRTGRPTDVRVASARDRWPQWTTAMGESGVRHVTCLPLRLVDRTIGGLELYSAGDQSLQPPARQVARVLAGLAVVVVRHDHALRSSSRTADQLSGALQKRVAVEQAKGFLCATGFADAGSAFDALRTYSRSTRRSVAEVSQDVVEGRLDPEILTRHCARGR